MKFNYWTFLLCFLAFIIGRNNGISYGEYAVGSIQAQLDSCQTMPLIIENCDEDSLLQVYRNVYARWREEMNQKSLDTFRKYEKILDMSN